MLITLFFFQHDVCGIYAYSPEFPWRLGAKVYFCFISLLKVFLLIILVFPVNRFINMPQKCNLWIWRDCLLSGHHLFVQVHWIYQSSYLLHRDCMEGYSLLNIKDFLVFIHKFLRIVRSKSWNDLSHSLILHTRELRGKHWNDLC